MERGKEEEPRRAAERSPEMLLSVVLKGKRSRGGPPVESGSGGRQGGIAASGGTDDRFDARDSHSIFVVDRI